MRKIVISRTAKLAVVAAASMSASLVGVTGATVAHAVTTAPLALILDSSVSPGVAPDGTESLEQYEAEAAGFTVTVADYTTWTTMSASAFQKYQVLIVGDPTCAGGEYYAQGAIDSASTWVPVVMSSGGNRVIIGTDPVYHYQYGGGGPASGKAQLIESGIQFAGYHAGATGLYYDSSCDEFEQPPAFFQNITASPPSDGSAAFSDNAAPCFGSISIIAASGPTSSLHDSDLSDWGCSVHEYFDKYPTDFVPLALATDPSVPATTEGKDVDTGADVSGSPYILVAGSPLTVTSSNISLDPATASKTVGSGHTVTATLSPATSGVNVSFSITGGPDNGKSGSGTTDGFGKTTFTFTNTGGAGEDQILATFTDSGGVTHSATATVDFTPVTSGPTCNGLAATIVSNASTVTGTSGDDVIVGGPANQTIKGMGGNDTICGMGGNDAINGGDGNDWIDGGDGMDIVIGGAGNDIEHGGGGTDKVGGTTNDTGTDQLFGDAGSDQCYGTSGDTYDSTCESHS